MPGIEKSPHQQAITAHFNALKNQQFEVSEWDGMVIHYSPLTTIERDELDALKCGESEFNVHVLIKKARNEDGTPCFTDVDIGWLKREAAPAVIREVALRIMTADLVDVKRLGEPSPPKSEA